MSMYTTAQLLAANEQKFKFDPLFLRLFFRESYPFTTEKVYLSQIPGLVNMALYVSPIVSGEVIRSRGGSTSEFTPGYVKPKHEVNPQMTLRRLPDEDPQNLADPAYRRRRIIMQNMRDEELAIAQVEEMQAVSAVLKGKYTMTGEAFDPVEVDIRQETLNECTRAEQSASVVLWEIDLTEVGGERYFFCNEQNEKGEPVTWQGRQYQPYPIQGSGFELNGKGTSTRPTLTVSNLYGMVTGMAEDMQSLVGGTVVRRKVYARFLDAVNFVNGNSDADPEQEVISRWRIEQCSELSAVSASFVLSTPTETDGAVFPGRIMLANTCTWTYRGDECGYSGPAVADEYDQPTSDITKDKCSKCLSGCKFRNNVGNFGGFLSINKLSQ